jgi:hypothetical protein
VTLRCLAEAYPDIVTACELELRYIHDHRNDFENQSTLKGQTSRRDMSVDYNLVPEVRSMIDKYRNFIL